MRLFERIDTICLTVKVVEQTNSLYQAVFGLKEIFQGDNYRFLKVAECNMPLTIEEGNTNHSQSTVYPIIYTKD